MLGAIIGGVLSLGGALLSNKSTKKAADKAADAEIQAARETTELARELYGRNTANFTPYLQSGQRANALLDTFLYGPQQAQAPLVAQGPAPDVTQPFSVGGGFGGGFSGANELTGTEFVPDYSIGMTAVNGRGAANLARARAQATIPGQNVAPAPVPAATPQPVAAGAPQNALSGYEAFTNSPYYQLPYQEGVKARNMGFAARGLLQSGAAEKELTRYGQDYAGGRLNEFLSLLQGQQNVGFGGASALAGVGQNMQSTIAQQNQNRADALGNAALIRAQANNSLYGSLAGIAGGLASSFGGFGK
jgi:hypothetical protein